MPTRPGGVLTLIAEKFCSPSCLEKVSVKGLEVAALAVTTPALNEVAKGIVLPQPVIEKDEDGVASGVTGALQGVRSAVVVKGPQVCGFARGARSPPFKRTFRSLKGNCGFSLNVVVSWPVLGFTDTLPLSLITTPASSTSPSSAPASRYTPNNSPFVALASVHGGWPSPPHLG